MHKVYTYHIKIIKAMSNKFSTSSFQISAFGSELLYLKPVAFWIKEKAQIGLKKH
jgi:hypothetical protein